jgi:uncharacterized cupin superfamily protein
MSSTVKAASVNTVKWVEVPSGWQKSEGMIPYEGETAHMLDWVENMQGRSAHLFAHTGQLIVDVVEIEPNAVHQTGKPGDEIVVVINGALQLITDATKADQTFHAGEMVMFRAGWAGIYRVMSDDGPFRELAIVPRDYFDASRPLPVSAETPQKIELPTSPGKRELFRNTYVVESERVECAKAWAITTCADEVVQVLSGRLTLRAGAEEGAFGKGSVVILPKDFAGEATASPGYSAVTARWNGGP